MIRTRPATKEYLDNWDKVFGKKNKTFVVSFQEIRESTVLATSDLVEAPNKATKKKRKRKPA